MPGSRVDDVDGIVSFSLLHDSVPCQAVATALALPQLRFAVDLDLGGQAPCHLVGLAAMAVDAGRARNVLVFRAMNGRSGARVGAMQFPGGGAPFRYPIGYDAYLMYCAMWARRFLIETGQDEHDLGAVASAQRALRGVEPRAPRAASRSRPRTTSPSRSSSIRSVRATAPSRSTARARSSSAPRSRHGTCAIRSAVVASVEYRAGTAFGPRHR